MAKIPPQLVSSELGVELRHAGLDMIYQGKVRDTFQLPGDLLLLVASDRCSIFDIVLPTTIKYKGEVLTALTVFWLRHVFSDIAHHLVAFGAGIDKYLPRQLQDNPELQARAMVVRKLSMRPIENVVRGYLTGSAWRDYQTTGGVCGHKLPADLFDGAKLPRPIWTPASKAETGHDENLPAEQVRREYGTRQEELSLAYYDRAQEYARERGIIYPDTKFEFSEDDILADEVLTPDSSRCWDRDDWEASAKVRKSPSSWDKEIVRKWGMMTKTPFGGTVKDLEPDRNPDHLRYVWEELEISDSVCQQTSDTYLAIFKRLVEVPLLSFQIQEMKIRVGL